MLELEVDCPLSGGKLTLDNVLFVGDVVVEGDRIARGSIER